MLSKTLDNETRQTTILLVILHCQSMFMQENKLSICVKRVLRGKFGQQLIFDYLFLFALSHVDMFSGLYKCSRE
jgi:hypothetical protein